MTDDDTVLVTLARGGGSSRRYHTQDCSYVKSDPDGFSEWRRETAVGWGLQQCEECAEREAYASDG